MFLKKTWYRRGGSFPTRKFAMRCQEHITADHPTTQDFVTIHTMITQSPQFKVFTGQMSPSKMIVAKVGDATKLKQEYAECEKLFNARIPNFIKYFCNFECNHGINANGSLCNGPGSSMGVLLMSNYAAGRFDKHRWDSPEQVKSILKQVVCACYMAFKRCAFVHKDLHLGNILVKRTKKQHIDYTLDTSPISVQCHGWAAVIMDFDRSITTKAVPALYRDLHRAINLSTSELNLKIDFTAAINKARSPPDEVTDACIKELCEAIDAGVFRHVDPYWSPA